MKIIFQKILKFYAKKVLKKYQPRIIGVTGSIGKSSAKESIYAVLKDYFNVRRSLKNYNNEIGVPLTILGRLSPGRSLAGWLRVFWMAIGSIWFREKSYPQILILEMAADHPGDIKYLTKIASCEIGVVTAIGPTHLEFFKNVENIVKEKQILVSHLPSRGWAILNADDEMVMLMKNKIEAKILTFGISEKADLMAIEIEIDQKIDFDKCVQIKGLRFKIKYHGNVVPVFLPKVLSKSQVYAALAAVAVGIALDMNLLETVEALRKNYKILPGRMSPIKGIKKTLIIDDTYNSSPKAVVVALETLREIKNDPTTKKWVILGDMLELGYRSEEEHKKIGKLVAQMGFDKLVVVGPEAKNIALASQQAGMHKSDIEIFENSQQAGLVLKNKIQRGDIILIKGSQGMRMEKIVFDLMAEPNKANQLLVRQDPEWLE